MAILIKLTNDKFDLNALSLYQFSRAQVHIYHNLGLLDWLNISPWIMAMINKSWKNTLWRLMTLLCALYYISSGCTHPYGAHLVMRRMSVYWYKIKRGSQSYYQPIQESVHLYQPLFHHMFLFKWCICERRSVNGHVFTGAFHDNMTLTVCIWW